MKSMLKALIFLCTLCALFATSATATPNDKLPTEADANSFLLEMKSVSSSDIFDKVKSDHTTWNADLLECSTCTGDKEAIAIYHTDSSAKGYGSIYFKDGKTVSPGSLKGYTVKESYKGELKESENDPEENITEPVEEKESSVIKDDETKKNSEYTYEAFSTALDDYDGKLDCSSKSCAESLSDYFKDLGWDAEVKYCVAVDTSDDGTVYVVLGA